MKFYIQIIEILNPILIHTIYKNFWKHFYALTFQWIAYLYVFKQNNALKKIRDW